MRMTRTVVARGFTLIELMVGITIFAFLTVLAVPMYGDFIANSQVRTAAESVLTGVRLAQAEAIHRSVPVRFELLAGGAGWKVVFYADEQHLPDCGAATNCISDNHLSTVNPACNAGADCIIRQYLFTTITTGAPYASITPTGGTEATFSSLGVLMANNDGSAALTRVDVGSNNYASARGLSVLIGTSTGGAKLCDASLAAGDPMSCPS